MNNQDKELTLTDWYKIFTDSIEFYADGKPVENKEEFVDKALDTQEK